MSSPSPSVLDVCSLKKRYGRVDVLRGLDLSVPEGAIYGLLGRNGAGKTTTLRTVMGIQRGDGGTLSFFGESVRYPRLRHLRSIGYVSQEQHFYDWMTCEQLGRFVSGFFPSWDASEFARLLETMDLPPRRRASDLSHGMKVKLGLVLALSHRPRLLILDEPTAGLDPAARREFLELVSVQAREDGRTTLFSSHIVEEVERISGVIGILDQGVLVFEGAPQELKRELRRAVVADAEREALEEMLPEEVQLISSRAVDDAHELVLRAPPATWEGELGADDRFEQLSLEDAFLAITVGRVFSA